jgi:hypothetical protein
MVWRPHFRSRSTMRSAPERGRQGPGAPRLCPAGRSRPRSAALGQGRQRPEVGEDRGEAVAGHPGEEAIGHRRADHAAVGALFLADRAGEPGVVPGSDAASGGEVRRAGGHRLGLLDQAAGELPIGGEALGAERGVAIAAARRATHQVVAALDARLGRGGRDAAGGDGRQTGVSQHGSSLPLPRAPARYGGARRVAVGASGPRAILCLPPPRGLARRRPCRAAADGFRHLSAPGGVAR